MPAAHTSAITPARATDLLRKADAAMKSLDKIKSKTEEKAGEVFKILETVGGGLAVGAIRGKYGAVEVGPKIPLEAIIGASLHAVGFLDLAGKHSEHVHNVANSVLTTWAALEGIKMMGGAVLSESEVKQIAARSAPATMTAGTAATTPAPVATAPVAARRRETPPALNGHGRGQSAREIVEQQRDETAVNQERGQSGQS